MLFVKKNYFIIQIVTSKQKDLPGEGEVKQKRKERVNNCKVRHEIDAIVPAFFAFYKKIIL